MADQDTRQELNRLYWESDASVGDIADRLGLSRRALYDDIEPRPAGAPCPECGAPLGYRNRTTAENGEAECPACGLETPMDAVRSGAAAAAGPAERRERPAPLSPTRRVPASGDAPVAALLLVVGLGLGAILAYWLRRS